MTYYHLDRVLRKNGETIFFDYYYGPLELGEVQASIELCSIYPNEAAKFLESLNEEHKLGSHKKMSHPEEFHKSPRRIIDLMEQSGFLDCKIIPTFCKEYLGIYGKRSTNYRELISS